MAHTDKLLLDADMSKRADYEHRVEGKEPAAIGRGGSDE
jgi:hypothetical protein